MKKYFLYIAFYKITMYVLSIRYKLYIRNMLFYILSIYLSIMLKHVLAIVLVIDNNSKKAMHAKFEIYFCNVAYTK